MSTASSRRPRTEIIIAIAATTVSICAIAYQDHSDLLADMVIPQQEALQLLYLNEADYIGFLVEELRNGNVRVAIQYESLYGEQWELTYPTLSHRRIN